jgi:hypothetical protein
MIAIGRSDTLNPEESLYFPSDESYLYYSPDNKIPERLWSVLEGWLKEVASTHLNTVDWKILNTEMTDTVHFVLESMYGFFSSKRIPLLMTASICLSAIYQSESEINIKEIASFSSGLFSEQMLYEMMIDLVLRLDLKARRPRRMIPTKNPRKILGILQKECLKRESELDWEKYNREMIERRG